MKRWQDELLLSADAAQSENQLFEKIRAASQRLGFEFCSYGLRMPLPVTRPRTVILSSYPVAWQERYQAMDYVRIDPTVAHGRRSRSPLVWSDTVFGATRDLWDEAQSMGLRVGWAQSSLDANGVAGMLSLARSGDPLSAAELQAKELQLRWLVSIAHLSLSRLLSDRLTNGIKTSLTQREVEVLKWTADGKTSGEISDILAVSESTVNFHVKNAISKLQTSNKTAAVVRAAMLGLLSY